MAILLVHGEDLDWTGGGGNSISTTAGNFRANYSRCGIGAQNSPMRSATPLAAGVTSAWAGCYHFVGSHGGAVGSNARLWFGMGQWSTGASGIFIGYASASGSNLKYAIYKFDGTTVTLLASEGGNSATQGYLNKIDLQVINYGVSATVNVYLNGALIVTYTGNVTIAGVSALDCMMNVGIYSANAAWSYFSECVMASEDTRGLGVITMAPNAVGTTDQWSGTYSTVNAVTLSDASPNFTNTAAQDQQYNLIDTPASTQYNVKAIQISARMAMAAGAVSNVALGYNTNSGVAVGTPKALTTAYALYMQIDAINPVTGLPWVYSDLTACQLDLRSS